MKRMKTRVARGNRLQPLLIATGDRDLGPRLGQAHGDAKSDPGSAPGHQRVASLMFHNRPSHDLRVRVARLDPHATAKRMESVYSCTRNKIAPRHLLWTAAALAKGLGMHC